MASVFLDLLVLRDGSGESFDARHVFAIVGKVVVADIETHHRPDGEKYIRGRTEDILVLTGTWGGRQPQS